ncbi:MAG TPA: AAA family ATPase [Blastococcus sp.]
MRPTHALRHPASGERGPDVPRPRRNHGADGLDVRPGASTTTRAEGPGTAGGLLGRDAELGTMQGFLGALGIGRATLVLRGQPGVGKTALLEAAARTAEASGMEVLRGNGVQDEADLGFAALHQILFPVIGGMTALDGQQARVLSVALGLDDGPSPERAEVCAATLSLVRAASVSRPLLVVVDDLHWVDRASAGVLGFLARRSGDSRIGFLGTTRSDVPTFFDLAGLPEREIGPLDDDASAALLRSRFPELASSVIRRLLEEAGGNPLALLELPSELTAPQRAAREPLPPVLPLTRRLRDVFSARIRELPPATRALLLLAALEGTGDLRRLTVAADRPVLDQLGPAARSGLVEVDPTAQRLRFRHPLVRSTVVATSSTSARRAAHQDVARAVADTPERHAWHLAEATVAVDEGVARLLEDAARRAMQRGDATGGVTALLRAADLSPRKADESRRLAEAACVGANVTGEMRAASELLVRARRTDPLGTGSLAAAVATAHVLLNGDGDIDTAHRLLVSAVDAEVPRRNPRDPDLRQALQTLGLICLWGQRADLWNALHALRARLPETPPPDLWERLVADPAYAPTATLEYLDTAISGLATETDLARIERIARAGTYVDRLSACREALERVVRDGRGEVTAVVLNAHIQLCFDYFLTGRWDDARRHADEGMSLATTHGYSMLSWPLRLAQALLAAACGRFGTVQAVTDEMTGWATPRGARAITTFAHHARALAALGRCDFEDAFRHASAISPAGSLPRFVPHAVWVPMDLVEAAVHSHRADEATAHVQALQEVGLAARSPRLALLTAASAAMAAPDSRAVDMFEAALALPGLENWPFDLARVHLAYGERLRRLRSTTPARVHLAAAQDVFRRLGATPWVRRAATELQATGLVKSRAIGGELPRLTPQEREVALLAASGLTNRQIADRMLLSPRTVGAHLRQVFPKLGVTSRAALRDALASTDTTIPAPLGAGSEQPDRVPNGDLR